MTALLRIPALSLVKRPQSRIALAIVLSVLAHMLLLFSPLLELPPSRPQLPPLIAKLEPLPVPAIQPAPPPKKKKRVKPKPKPQPTPVMVREPAPEAEPVAQEETQIDAEPQLPAASTAEEESPEEARPAHPLPKRAHLTFTAYKGKDFPIGEAHHYLEIDGDNRYTLRVVMGTTGLASIFKSYESEQQSSGILTAEGLRPEKYAESKSMSGGSQALEATFSWQEKLLSFSNGGNTPLPEQAQDIISFAYQLSQLPLDTGAIPMHVSNGKKLEHYELVVGEVEMVQTGIGWLRALPLHKTRMPGEEGLDIWLGLEYRLLPVKIRMSDRDGNIAGEMVVSEMRVADE